MKMTKIFKTMMLVGLMGLTATSCEKYFDGVNEDPNRPTEVTPNLLLPSAQAFFAYGNGGDLTRFTSMFMQQITGASRQFATYQNYNVGETDMDNWWRFNMYGGALYDLRIIIDYSEANALPQYAGIGKILMAYGIMTITDVMGSIPYSAAFKTNEGLQPAYDTQEEIYATIETLLTQAKSQLAEPEGNLVPGADDLIYGGDAALWTSAANVLLARMHIHLGKVSAAHYSQALAAIDAGGFTSNADDAIFNYGSDETAANPWYQYIGQRDDIVYTGFIYDTMDVMGDPRLDVYVDGTGYLGPFFSSPNSPFYFTSYVEQKFIEAEAAFQTGDLLRASAAHNDGVLASLDRFSVTDPTFVLNEASETAATITLEKIMLHKYIAMFLDPEVFVDWRRTGFPELEAVANNVTGGVIPRRLPYPLTERTFNGSNVPSVPSITSRVWWDVP